MSLRRVPKPPAVDPSTQDLVDQVQRYVNEVENPAPDLTMRQVEFHRMRAALRGWRIQHGEEVRGAQGTGDGDDGGWS